MKNKKTVDLINCAIFVALIIAGTFIKIPIPVLPFTLQILFTTMAGLILGGPLGATSVYIYIIIGLIGFPVFTQGGGLSYVFQPTFGYLIGFALGALISGYIANKDKSKTPTYKRLLFASFTSLITVYTFGMIYYYIIMDFYLGTPIGLWPLFFYCFILAVPGDILLCIIAAVLSKRLIPAIRKYRGE